MLSNILSMMFLDRSRELTALGRIVRGAEAQLILIYGRRRIGKTALLTHWTRQHPRGPHFYWTAYRTSSDLLLKSFSERFRKLLAPERGPFVFASWEAAFEELFKLAANGRRIAVIDEYPYLMESVPEISTLLQRLWDERKGQSQIALTLCGSHYHMMHKELLHPQGPLYGRSTAALAVGEIAPDELGLFLPRYSPEQVVATYAVIGGVPKYLSMWRDDRPVLRNIRALILSPSTLFRHEAQFLIQDEIAEPRTYLAILEALGAGLKSPSRLADITGVHLNHMGKYLSTLRDLRIVRRVISEDAPNRSNTRLSRYETRDPFLRFYFEMLHHHQGWLEQGRIDKLYATIADAFNAFVGKTAYEELARRTVSALGDAGELSFEPHHVGRAWTRNAELDVVAINRDAGVLMVGECKWRGTKMHPESVEQLRARVAQFKRLRDLRLQLALFSKAGFTKPLQRLARQEGILLFEGGAMTRVG